MLALAIRHPQTPWFAKALGFGVIAYALSPIDLIPDFIPILGMLDDVLLVPLGIALILPLIPPDVRSACRQQADEIAERPRSLLGAGVVLVVWALTMFLAWNWYRHRR